MPNLVMVPPITRSVRLVEFRLDGKRVPKAKWVALVGSFNRWDTAAHRMVRGSDGVWTIALTLAPGEYPYLFIVDGIPWNDPLDDQRVPCEWGGQYSVRVVRQNLERPRDLSKATRPIGVDSFRARDVIRE